MDFNVKTIIKLKQKEEKMMLESITIMINRNGLIMFLKKYSHSLIG